MRTPETRSERRAVGALLRASLQDPAAHDPVAIAELAAEVPAATLRDRSLFHCIPGYVHRAIRDNPGVSGRLIDHLAPARYAAVGVHLQAMAGLSFLSEVLAGQSWVVFKGPVLASLVHGEPGLRSYGDLDVLVAPEDFPSTVDGLESAGAQVLVHDWRLWLEEQTGEIPVRLPNGTILDLHWDLLNDPRNRARFSVPTQEILARAPVTELDGVPVRTLQPEDGLLYLLVHTATSGANRLVWLKDIERTIAVMRPDPDVVAARCRRAGVALLAATVLDKVARTLGSPAADELSSTLGRRRFWRFMATATTVLSPPEEAAAGRSLDRVVSRSVGRGSGDSLIELARKGVLRLVERVHPGHTEVVTPSSSGPDDPSRHDYLSWVSTPTEPRRAFRSWV